MTLGCVQEKPTLALALTLTLTLTLALTLALGLALALALTLTLSCVQEKAPCFAPGVRPFRGNRQRLDRCDPTYESPNPAIVTGSMAYLP